MNYNQAKQIDIVYYLTNQGFQSKKIRGNNVWYLSPIKKEKTASFKVDISKNLFFDFSTGIGGTIIDLVMLLNNCTSYEALVKLSDGSFSFHQPKVSSEKEKNYTITKVTTLKNGSLLDYLNQRKINLDFAKKFCKEVHYTYRQEKYYYGIGFKNDAGGFEIRNKYYKNCLIKKSLTTIIINSETASIFESWTDFLSYLTLKKKIPKEDFIILNSTALIEKAAELLQNYKTLKVFFDNDSSGNLAFKFIKNKVPNKTINCSVHYKDFNDLNDYLMSM